MATLPTIKSLISPFKPKSLVPPSPTFKSLSPTPNTYKTLSPLSANPTPIQPAVQTPTPTPFTAPKVTPQITTPAPTQNTPVKPILPQVTPDLSQGGTGTPPEAPKKPSGESSTPTTPVLPPETQKAVETAEKAVSTAQAISPDELSTQEDIDKLIASTKSAYNNIKDKPIPLEFITGQLASVERRAIELAEPLERKLARLQSARTSALETSKFALTRADLAQKTAEEKAKGTEVGGAIVRLNPATGKYETVYEKPKEKEKPIVVSAGSTVIDPETGKPIYTAPKQASESEITKAGEKADAKKTAQSQSISNLSLVNELLSMNTGKITGAGQNPLNFVFGLGNAEAQNKYKELKGQLALEKRTLLKGSGAISDFEAKTLDQAASSLSRSLSNEAFQKELKKIKGVFSTAAGLEAEVRVTSKAGEKIDSTASREEIESLIAEGNTVEYR